MLSEGACVTPIETYAAFSKSPNSIYTASGGIFYEIARYALEQEWIVFGATYDESLSVKHIMITNVEGLYRLQGSKYVRSDLGDCIDLAVPQIHNGSKVVFSGTPCQIVALKKRVGISEVNPKSLSDFWCSYQSDNLLTIELFVMERLLINCFGVFGVYF